MELRQIIFLLSLIACCAYGSTIRWTISIPPESISVSSTRNGDEFYIRGGSINAEEGEFALPVISNTWLIPQGAIVDSVVIETSRQVTLPGIYDPSIQRFFNCIETSHSESITGKTQNLSLMLPIRSVFQGRCSGYELVTVIFSPLMYAHLSGEMDLFTETDLILYYSIAEHEPFFGLTQRQIETARTALSDMVENPEMLDIWGPDLNPDSDEIITWIAIGDESLEDAVTPLIQHRILGGEEAAFKSLQWISANYPGYDTPEKIRNCLIDLYWNSGLIYALIIGDDGPTVRISSLKLSVNPMNTITDLYYSDLDGTWDYNGNHLYGESDDQLDYYTDIHVGRFPADDPQSISDMVQKTIDYESAVLNDNWTESVLLCGAAIYPENGIWGSEICDQVAAEIPPYWTKTEWYEDSLGNHPGNLVDPLNKGYSYVEIAAHGSWEFLTWYYPPHELLDVGLVQNLQNAPMTPVFHSMACDVGNITAEECLGEELLQNSNGGAVATMFNSSTGWLTSSGSGPSVLLDIYFPLMMFENSIDIIGIANSCSKNLLFSETGYIVYTKWVIQTNNLFGDPATSFISSGTGLEEEEYGCTEPAKVMVYPNPTESGCLIRWSTPVTDGEAVISIYDISGRIIRKWILPDSTEGTISFSCVDSSGEPIPSGCYIVYFKSRNLIAVSRLILID